MPADIIGDASENKDESKPDEDPHQAADAEVREVHGAVVPYKPSPKDIAEHNLTHLNYRAWCPVCVRARGVSDPHRHGVDRSDRSVAAVCADYCFMSRDPNYEHDDDDDKPGGEIDDVETSLKEKATILNVKDSQTGCLRSHLVPRKGIAGVAWIGKEVANDLTLWGHNNCIFKSDQEVSMVAVYNEVAKMRVPYKLVPEHSPKGDSQSNGLIERANRSVKGQVRVFLLALEANINKKIDLRHPMVAWLVTHAGFVITHYEVGKDGRTAYEAEGEVEQDGLVRDRRESPLHAAQDWRRRTILD